jgi:hypothetical protein
VSVGLALYRPVIWRIAETDSGEKIAIARMARNAFKVFALSEMSRLERNGVDFKGLAGRIKARAHGFRR